MDTNKLIEKLEGYLNLSKNKQQEKKEKLVKIIHKLEKKKSRLEADLITQSKIDETSGSYSQLQQELRIVSRLIKKAKKQFQGASGVTGS